MLAGGTILLTDQDPCLLATRAVTAGGLRRVGMVIILPLPLVVVDLRRLPLHLLIRYREVAVGGHQTVRENQVDSMATLVEQAFLCAPS